MRALGAEVGVFVDGAAECECGVIVQDGEEDGEGELELGVESVDGSVLEEEEGLDLLEEGWGEGLVGIGCSRCGVGLRGVGSGVWGGDAVGVRVWHVHSTFVLGWGVVELVWVEVVEIVTGERLRFCKWLWWFGEWGLGFWVWCERSPWRCPWSGAEGAARRRV